MSAPSASLLLRRRFGPLFTVQFLGAFNDNLLKFALLFLANYALAGMSPMSAEMLAIVATGVFILPYFLLSAMAGQLADSMDKTRIARVLKGAEVVIMGVALAGFALGSVWTLLGCLFAMGVHSTFFGSCRSICAKTRSWEELVSWRRAHSSRSSWVSLPVVCSRP